MSCSRLHNKALWSDLVRQQHSPLVHVMFSVVQPHPHLDGVPLPDPVEDVLHLVLAVLLLLNLVVGLAEVDVVDGQVLRRQVLPAAPHPTALRPTHYFPLTSPKSPSSSSSPTLACSCLFLPPDLLPHCPLPPAPASCCCSQVELGGRCEGQGSAKLR